MTAPTTQTTKRADASPWEGNGWVVTVDGYPVGATLREAEAREVARWLNDGALREIDARRKAA